MVSVIKPQARAVISFFPFLISPILNIYLFHLEWTEFFSLLWWYLLFILIGLVSFGFVSLVFSGLTDKAYGISKTVGFVIVGYLTWIFQVQGLPGYFNLPIILGLVVLLSAGAFSVLKIWGRNKFKELLISNYSHILNIEGIFSFVFFTYLGLKSYSPDIWWGEKPMDFSLINFFIRNQQMPAIDPWFNGKIMHYYYLGYFFIANTIKITLLSSSTGYLAAICTLPALMASSLYSFFISFLKRRYMSIIAASFLVFASNWASFWNKLVLGNKLNIIFFWRTSRVFEHRNFSEFPSWSFLFADLHPHVIAYPITATLLVFFLPYMSRSMITRNWGAREAALYILLMALLFGGLIGINGWDLIIWSIIWALILIMNIQFPIDWKKFILLPGAIGLLSLFLYFPMLSILASGKKTMAGMVHKKFNNLGSYFMHDGHWLLLIMLVAIPLLWALVKKNWSRVFTLDTLSILPPVLLPISLILINPRSETTSIVIFCLLFLLLLLLVKLFSVKNTAINVATSLSACAVFLMILAEHFFFMDRYNTIFKTFNTVWVLLGVSLFALFRYLIILVPKSWARLVSFRYSITNIFAFLIGLIAFATLLGTGFNVYALKRFNYLGTKLPTLNGTEYVKRVYPEEHKIIDWLNNNVEGIPGMVEAYVRLTDHKSCGINIHTGLPLHLGWNNHVLYRGVKRKDLSHRKLEVDRIYKSSDALKTYELLKKLKIKYVVVGPREIRKYGRKGLLKFQKFSELFQPVVKGRYINLYEVR